jgi:hypothetical protein
MEEDEVKGVDGGTGAVGGLNGGGAMIEKVCGHLHRHKPGWWQGQSV